MTALLICSQAATQGL